MILNDSCDVITQPDHNVDVVIWLDDTVPYSNIEIFIFLSGNTVCP
jgi:hypothetical protein